MIDYRLYRSEIYVRSTIKYNYKILGSPESSTTTSQQVEERKEIEQKTKLGKKEKKMEGRRQL